jgi:ribosomal-protein-alanine N-acetyltransferase
MLEFNFSPFPTLTTDRLILRQVTREDVNEIFFLRSDEEVMRYIERPRAKTPEEAYSFIELINSNAANNSDIAWGICLKDDLRLIGYLGFWRIKPENHRGETGYALHPQWQGKGIASEALMAVIDYGFKTMKLHSIEANVNPDNLASIKLLEHTGFTREAYFKEDFYWNGQFLDSAIYSLLTPYR